MKQAGRQPKKCIRRLSRRATHERISALRFEGAPCATRGTFVATRYPVVRLAPNVPRHNDLVKSRLVRLPVVG
jgi:hypothetical protein